jgi:hypothetical protein
MAEASITFNAEKLVGELNALTRVQIPRAGTLALNTALFETRKRLRAEASTVFKSLVPFTLNSFLYQKAERVGDDLHARVFIRDDAPKGNAPTRYLNPHIRGGRAYETRFQKSLTNTVVQQIDGRSVQARPRGTMLRPTGSRFVKPNTRKPGAPYPTMSQGQYNSILSSLKGGKSSADYLDTGSVPYSNNRRYVYLDEEALETDYFKRRFTSHPRKPGVYYVQRQQKQPRFYRVLSQQRIPSYSAKFKFFDLSKEQIGRTFQKEFDRMILR